MPSKKIGICPIYLEKISLFYSLLHGFFKSTPPVIATSNIDCYTLK